jgi:hypothetical protein
MTDDELKAYAADDDGDVNRQGREYLFELTGESQ